MKTVCIIPARGGSTRIPGKNIKEFFGKPIIQYSIEAAKHAEIFDRIIVSTDDHRIADAVLQPDVDLYMRSDALAHNAIGTQAVTKDVLLSLEPYDLACCLYATVPMIDSIELRQAHAHLRFDSRIDYVVPIAKWLEDPGRWYFGRAKSFLDDVPLDGPGTRLMKVSKRRAIDINTPEDWAKAEIMYSQLQEGGGI